MRVMLGHRFALKPEVQVKSTLVCQILVSSYEYLISDTCQYLNTGSIGHIFENICEITGIILSCEMNR